LLQKVHPLASFAKGFIEFAKVKMELTKSLQRMGSCKPVSQAIKAQLFGLPYISP
jgi:hypothetical protein